MITTLIGKTLRQDQQNELVARLHRILEVLGQPLSTEDPTLFTETTHTAVYEFQKRNGIEPTGIVEGNTAELLEQQYLESGFGIPHRISGIITDEKTGNPLENILVQLWDKYKEGPDNLLDEVRTDARGQYAITFDEMSYGDKDDGGEPLPTIYFQLFDGERLVHQTTVDENKKFPKGEYQFSFELAEPQVPETANVSGHIYTPKRVGAPGVRVVAVDKNIGREVELGETLTDNKGYYSISYETAENLTGKDLPDIQIRVTDESNVLGNSAIRYDAAKEEVINVILPADSIQEQDEYQKITGALRAAAGDTAFKDLHENEEQQDITYLANKTGWDARLVAMVSLADKYSSESDVPAPLYYSLFRAGLSTDAKGVNELDNETVANVWNKAADENIIAASFKEHIDENVNVYNEKSTEYLLEQAPAVGVSTLNNMLDLSLQDDDQKRAFVNLYYNSKGDTEKLWEDVEEQFGQDTKNTLQSDGKLGLLTINNAPLISLLRNQNLIQNDPVELVQQGLYKAESWNGIIANDIEVPEDFPGEDAEEKKQNYIDYMTSQLKVSYPTAVLAEQVNQEEFTLKNTELKEQVTEFLRDHQATLDFGKTPVVQYIKDNELQVPDELEAALKSLQRTYQISPSDETMQVLLEEGLDSACAIVQFGEKEFIERFKDRLGKEEARLIYAKAHQIHSTVLNLATGYLTHKRNPGIYAISGGMDETSDTTAPLTDIIAYPTLESLFGEMDFCECKHCRSVLSPAAYLVDLLKFIDKNPTTEDEEVGRRNPLEVLLQRRPDIQHIQLTCENTNTVLPYIDLVNEILEHFVVHANQESIDISDPAFNPLEGFEGYNLDENITTSELLANPQFVKAKAYEVLKQQVYPFGLPFNQPLEALRRLFDHLEVPLYQAMRRLRPNDDPTTWQKIYMEYLSLSQEEYAILTNNEKTIAEYYGEDAGADLNAVLNANEMYAKDFSRKVDITYKELVEIVKIWFINPASRLIPKLEKLYIPINDIVAFLKGDIDDAAFDELLTDDLDAEPYGGDVKTWLREREDAIKKLILLVDRTGSEDECSFVQIELRHADDTPIEELDYFKLMRFIRLWKKLGWTIEQTDKTIAALWTNAEDANTIELLNQGFTQLITKIAHLQKVMELLKSKPRQDLLKVLALFANIDTHGSRSLYKTFFLNTSITNMDKVFLGSANEEYLTDEDVKVLQHEPALLAAFNLTSEKLTLLLEGIVERTGDLNAIEDVPLTLQVVSSLHRYSYLSRQLKLSIEELLILQDLSQIDPFNDLEEVNPGIIAFTELVQRLKEARIKISHLTYYLRHEDLSGEASPSGEDMLALAKRLKDELQRIEIENAAIDDATGEAARTKMALLYDQDVVDQFFNIINGTVSFSETYDHHLSALENEVREASSELSYNDFQKTLSFRGIMTAEEQQVLQDAAVIIPEADSHRADFLAAIQSLFDQGQDIVQHFFSDYPELQVPYTNYLTGNNFDQLLEEILATYKEGSKNLTIRQTLADALAIGLDLATALLNNKAVLHAITDNNEPAIQDYLALETNGVSAVYLFQDDTVEEHTLENINTDLEDHQLPDTQPLQRVTYRFYVETQEKAFYNLRLETDNEVNIQFFLNGQTVNGENRDGVWKNTDAIELDANRYHLFTVQAENITEKAILKWAPENGSGGYQLLPADQLYPEQPINHFKQNYLRLLKAMALLEMLDMTTREIRYFGETFQIDGAGYLNAIPITFDPTDTIRHKTLLGFTIDLLHYRQLKEALEVENDDLITVLSNPSSTYTNSEEEEKSLLLKITKWKEANLNELLDAFVLELSDLSDIKNLYRVWEAYQIVQTAGLSAVELIGATTNQPDPETVTNLEQALRIKYDTNAWLNVIQPLNDELRNIQRNVLVAYVLQLMQQNDKTKPVDTADKLFEYFLIDVQMDACMKTSRIKQALSSVQLFINRCLINLEPRVASTYINAKQWEWMKRYRVWEANRKVFLYPENWVEPELRDNKSHFFKDLESELLQSDITEDAAHVALLHYLEKLDEVAKLEISGMYLDEKEANKDGAHYGADDVLHVLGRTSGANRKYYYRRYEYGYWTPWEKVELDIEDNPILPVVWNGRLFLFWLNILTKGPENKKSNIKPNGDGTLAEAKIDTSVTLSNKVTVEVNLSWSEYYNGKWQPRRTSDFENPAGLGSFDPNRFDRTNFLLEATFGDSDELFVHLVPQGINIGPYVYFKLFNKHSLPIKNTEDNNSTGERCTLLTESFWIRNTRKFENLSNTFSISYNTPFIRELDEYEEEWLKHEILRNAGFSSVVFPPQKFGNILQVPFFFQNRRHVFFVEPYTSEFTVKTFEDFGVITIPRDKVVIRPEFPELWEQPQIYEPRVPEPIDPFLNTPLAADPRWIDPSPIEVNFMGSNLRNGFLKGKSVRVGNRVVSASGSVNTRNIGINAARLQNGRF